MGTTMQRERVRFASGGAECAAWHYPGTNGACVIMAAGGAVTKEPGTDRYARRFHEAGYSVLAFDYRNLGESGGTPRQVIRIGEQLADWDAALDCAATLPGVDARRLALWGFSLSGGHVLHVATRHPEVVAAIAQTPLVDGPAASMAASRYQTVGATLRTFGRVLHDVARGVAGGDPLLIPLAGEPGTIALLTTPDSRDADRALNPDNAYPEWQQEVAARSVLAIGSYRAGRVAARVGCPLLVVACSDDQSALAAPAEKAAQRAPLGELVRMPGGHYAPFLDSHEDVVEAELAFLYRHV